MAQWFALALLVAGAAVLLWRRGRRSSSSSLSIPSAPPEVPKQSAAATIDGSDPEGEIRGYAANSVAAGFSSEAEIVESATEISNDEYPGKVDEFTIRRIVKEDLRRHALEAESWEAVTDCDRLDSAFDALEESGIVARQNFACCQNCGHAEIWDEVEQLSSKRDIRGYTFFHMQDTESAVEGHGLCLAYGATTDSDDEAVQIGHEVTRALRSAGLHPQWDGQLSKRISLPLDWKRRRTARLD